MTGQVVTSDFISLLNKFGVILDILTKLRIPSVIQMGHHQTAKIQMRCRETRHLIRFCTVCNRKRHNTSEFCNSMLIPPLFYPEKILFAAFYLPHAFFHGSRHNET